MFSLIFIQLFQKSPPLFFQLPFAQFAARSIPVPLQREARSVLSTIWCLGPCSPCPTVTPRALSRSRDRKLGSTRRRRLFGVTLRSPERGSQNKERGGQGGTWLSCRLRLLHHPRLHVLRRCLR